TQPNASLEGLDALLSVSDTIHPSITEYEDTTPATLPEPTQAAASPTVPAPTATPRWMLNAQPVTVPQGNARLAIVIDDMGVDDAATRDAMRMLPAAVTFSFLPYGKSSRHLAEDARAAGHE